MQIKKGNPREFESIKIGLASTEKIMSWSRGEVEKPETINYRTFKPERKGLFDEKIFGPVKDWECHCGKYRRIRYRGIVCERCGVEVTTSRVRRERMGHIKLAVPVSHVWFLRGTPGFIGIALDASTKLIEEVIYYDAYMVTEVTKDTKEKIKLKEGQVLREPEYQEAREKYGNSFKVEMGAKAVREVLSKVDVAAQTSKLRRDLKGSEGQKRIKIVKRLRVMEAFFKSGNHPEWMILEVIPVMPPDLRPMVQLEGGRFATSDLNDLYRRILNRNNRLKKIISMGAPDMIVRNEKRMLQEAVDVLIDNGRRKRAVTGSTGRPLKSLSDIIEGKQGRFRQNLLGKRTDYSGRSVIVVGPTLKMHQCGLPKEMALELFKPFVIRKLVERGLSQNVKSAKRHIEKREIFVWDILEEVIKGHPVLLNRAPTLHRLGIQAFEPILVEGKAIQIHPLVCPAFNADFDGDQMAVHVPLLTESCVEARLLMLSSRNILSPASGRPIITPTQDMVLGVYYMTVEDERVTLGKDMNFSSENEAMIAHDLEQIQLHSLINVRVDGKLIRTTVGRIKFNNTLTKVIANHIPGAVHSYINYTIGKKELESLIKSCYEKFGANATSEIADEIKRLGFKYATIAGITISIEDLKVPGAKKNIVNKATKQVESLDRQLQSGSISSKEHFMKSIDIWSTVTENVTDAMLKEFDKLNSVYLMAFSGARGNLQQVRQLAGIRGLMADPSGNIISIPIKANFKEGLNVTEYFISSYGARKGLVDTALRTADSGYLTRRLVDVAQDVIITEPDCGSEDGIILSSIKEGLEEILQIGARLVGRIAVKNISDPISGKVIVKSGEEINDEAAKAITEAGIEHVKVRSVLTCKTQKGLCQLCYGRDLSHGGIVNIGEAVGIIAAQSIGEPGTQLTMRTFHIGGVALHKTTKVPIKVKHAGKVEFGSNIEVRDVIDENGEKAKMATRESIAHVKVKDKKEAYVIPVGALITAKEGMTVAPGDAIAEYDSTFDYVVTSVEGKAMYLGLLTTERKRKIEEKTLTDMIAKNDGAIFVYNPKVRKEYEITKDKKTLVKVGDRVKVDDELAEGVVTKIAGVVLEVKGKEIVVVPGEYYTVIASSKVVVEDGDAVKPYDLLAKVESMSRDPSKTKDIIQGLPKVEELFEARRPKDPAILSEIEGTVEISEKEGSRIITVHSSSDKREYVAPYDVRLKVASGDKIAAGTAITDGAINLHDILRILNKQAVQVFLSDEVQKIYRGQGVSINDKHIEVIVRQMTNKVRVVNPGDTILLPGELIEKNELDKVNDANKGEAATATEVLLGITKASLSTESFISAASFQETARILTEAAIKGRTDKMYGLKENVIIGKLIPAGTGFSAYRSVELVPFTMDGAAPIENKEGVQA
jgi:DNA-directed RNA polymerase beta' subunit